MRYFLILFFGLLSFVGYGQAVEEFGARFVITDATLIPGTDSFYIVGFLRHPRSTFNGDSVLIGDIIVDADCNVFTIDSILGSVSNTIEVRVMPQDTTVNAVRKATGGILRSNAPPNGTFTLPANVPIEILDCLINYNFKALFPKGGQAITMSGDTINWGGIFDEDIAVTSITNDTILFQTDGQVVMDIDALRLHNGAGAGPLGVGTLYFDDIRDDIFYIDYDGGLAIHHNDTETSELNIQKGNTEYASFSEAYGLLVDRVSSHTETSDATLLITGAFPSSGHGGNVVVTGGSGSGTHEDGGDVTIMGGFRDSIFFFGYTGSQGDVFIKSYSDTTGAAFGSVWTSLAVYGGDQNVGRISLSGKHVPTSDVDIDGKLRIRSLPDSTFQYLVVADANGRLARIDTTGFGGGGGGTDSQTLSWNGANGELTISGGNTQDLDGRYLQAEVDGSISNEIQTLTWNGTTDSLFISSGNGVSLADLAITELDDIPDVSVPTPITGDHLVWSGTNWISAQTNVTVGSAREFYLDTTASIADNYTLSLSPSVYPEVANVKAVTSATQPVFFERFISPQIGLDTIPAGIWEFRIYAASSNLAGQNEVRWRINKRVDMSALGITGTWTGAGATRTLTVSDSLFGASDANADRLLAALIETPNQTGWITAYTDSNTVTVYLSDPAYVNETNVPVDAVYYYLFNTATPDITSSSPTLYTVTSVQPAHALNGATDRLVAAFFAYTNGGPSRNITLYYGGTTRYSHFITPLNLSHNDLQGLNEGDYIHLTSAEYTDVLSHAEASIYELLPLGDVAINALGNSLIVTGLTTLHAETDVGGAVFNLSDNDIQLNNAGGSELNQLYGTTSIVADTLDLTNVGQILGLPIDSSIYKLLPLGNVYIDGDENYLTIDSAYSFFRAPNGSYVDMAEDIELFSKGAGVSLIRSSTNTELAAPIITFNNYDGYEIDFAGNNKRWTFTNSINRLNISSDTLDISGAGVLIGLPIDSSIYKLLPLGNVSVDANQHELYIANMPVCGLSANTPSPGTYYGQLELVGDSLTQAAALVAGSPGKVGSLEVYPEKVVFNMDTINWSEVDIVMTDLGFGITFQPDDDFVVEPVVGDINLNSPDILALNGTTSTDINGGAITFFGLYEFEASPPSNTVGDTSIQVWVGDGVGMANPMWLDKTSFGGGAADGNGLITALPAGNVSINAANHNLAISNAGDITFTNSGSEGLTLNQDSLALIGDNIVHIEGTRTVFYTDTVQFVFGNYPYNRILANDWNLIVDGFYGVEASGDVQYGGENVTIAAADDMVLDGDTLDLTGFNAILGLPAASGDTLSIYNILPWQNVTIDPNNNDLQIGTNAANNTGEFEFYAQNAAGRDVTIYAGSADSSSVVSGEGFAMEAFMSSFGTEDGIIGVNYKYLSTTYNAALFGDSIYIGPYPGMTQALFLAGMSTAANISNKTVMMRDTLSGRLYQISLDSIGGGGGNSIYNNLPLGNVTIDAAGNNLVIDTLNNVTLRGGGIALIDADVQVSMQSDSGNVILRSHLAETAKQSSIQIATNEIVLDADSIQIFGAINDVTPDSILGISGTLMTRTLTSAIDNQTLSSSRDTLTIADGNSIRTPGTAFLRDSVSNNSTLTIDLKKYRGAIAQVRMESVTATITLTVNNPWSALDIDSSYPSMEGETSTYTFHFVGVSGTDPITWPANFYDMAGTALGTDNLIASTKYVCYYDPVAARYYCSQ